MSKTPEEWEKDYARASGVVVGDGVGYDGEPEPTSLLAEMLLLVFDGEQRSMEPNPAPFEYLCRERLFSVLQCPGCLQGAVVCPEHGKVGDFTHWMHAKCDALLDEEDAEWSLEDQEEVEWAEADRLDRSIARSMLLHRLALPDESDDDEQD
jgi:hypothetical protein